VGDYGFITCQRIGLADGARADAVPNAAGGEGGHGAAKRDPVIHRCCVRTPERQSRSIDMIRIKQQTGLSCVFA
jgi:hypothetical protein